MVEAFSVDISYWENYSRKMKIHKNPQSTQEQELRDSIHSTACIDPTSEIFIQET